MNKDEIQLSKALIKLKSIKRLIDILQDLNLTENDKDMKDYNIILDYKKDEDQNFTTFKVKIDSKGLDKHNIMVNKSLYNFNFKLKDENTGFALFKVIREYFVMKNDLKCPNFQTNPYYNINKLNFITHEIETNHHVKLTSMIHSKKDEEKLIKFNNRIYQKYDKYIRRVHTVDYDKDEIQILKAEKKKEIVFVVIDMLNELNNTNTCNKQYEIFMDYERVKDCYKFKIQILKDNKSMPLDISFKLNDLKVGTEIFNEIVKYYIDNTNIECPVYGNDSGPKVNYGFYSKNRVNLTYRIPSEYFRESVTSFENLITIKEKAKKLKNAK